MKIAHFITDEKFPDFAYEQFETVAPSANTYYIVSSNKQLKHIKKIQPVFLPVYFFYSQKIIHKMLSYDIIVIHSLTLYVIKLVHKLKKFHKRPKIVWVGFGFDYYNIIYPNRDDMLLTHTKMIKMSYRLSLKDKIKIFPKYFVKKIMFISLNREEVINNVDFFAPVVPQEHKLLKDKLDWRSFPQYIKWNYLSTNKIITTFEGLIVDRDRREILIGNSATMTCNHIEIFDFLDKHRECFDKIICPLSYGNHDYGRYIKDIGVNMFQSIFDPMTEFMDFDAYVSKISKCAVVIMNHIRQQAAGNIAIMLFLGATVFVRKENPLYDFYVSHGFTIFTVQALERDPSLLTYRLTDAEIQKNKEICRKLFNANVGIKNTSELIRICS